VAVFPSDVILGDDDGVMVIPAHLADQVSEECLQMTSYEEFVMEKVNEGRSIIGLYPPTDPQSMEDFEVWKEASSIK
jgi:regulator of RNase E activity RraA